MRTTAKLGGRLGCLPEQCGLTQVSPLAVDGAVVKVLGWPDIEAAVGRQDWTAALKLVREFEREWRTVRGFVGACGSLRSWSRVIDEAMADLLAVLEARPVDPVALERAMAWFRRFAS